MWYTEQMKRFQILAVIVIAVIGGLLLRLAWMQILQGAQYKQVAEQNRIRQISAQAPRGTIYDRNGAPIVANRPSFAISIILADYTYPEVSTPLLSALTGVAVNEIEQMLQAGQEFPYSPIRVIRDADEAVIAKVQERKSYLPGVIVETLPVRHYVYNQLAAHTLGYLGRISEDEYAVRKKQGYNPNDLVGKSGIERLWEAQLRGIDGGLQVEVNAMGEEVGVVGEKAALPGKGIVLTLDANLQKAAEAALANQIEISKSIGEPAKGGAVVVMDVRTGGILALVSNPAFDPNVFIGGVSQKDWSAILNNKNDPLSNRAIQNAYPPGSVFKIVTAAAALESGLTTGQEVFVDKGVYVLQGWSFYGWETKGLGKLNVADALAFSSDPVFYELGRRLGADNLASYALTFGFGKLTGIELSGEEAGVVPTEAWKEELYKEQWYPGETLIAAIGQGYYNATPIQQAMLLMAVANGGIVYKPKLVDKLLTADGELLEQK
ncbi:MAG: mrdA 2, partial [Anaerospora sp.]|nr:mrdA 2 [Anaerospora sp.]